MSRIDELVAKLCPEGVAYKAFGEVGTLTRGKRFVKSDIVESGTPCIHYGELYTKYGIWATQAFSYLDPELASRLRVASPGDVIFVSAGETIEDIGKAVAWLGNEDVVTHDALYAFRSPLDPKFVAYFSQTVKFHNQIRRHISSAKISAISTENLAKVRIPVPPLEVQREIVRVLDALSQLEAELEAQLEAELETRRRQYRYYRDALLTLSEAPRMLVSDLFDFKNGLNKGKEFFGKGSPIVNFVDVFKNHALTQSMINGRVEVTPKEQDLYSARKNDVFFTRTSETREEIGKVSVLLDDIENCVFSGFVLRARPKTNLLLPKFCAYIFSSPDLRKEIIRNSSYTTRALTNGGVLSRLRVPIPSMEEQARIVAILDNFDALVNDISSGLPAEISARQQQYAHYRDRLLTFKEAA